MAREIESMGLFDIIEDAAEILIACWRLKKDVDAAWTLYDLADRLRMRGWLVPAYPLPADLESIDVQRLVVRQDFLHGAGHSLHGGYEEDHCPLGGRGLRVKVGRGG